MNHHKACEGCQWQRTEEPGQPGNWCYMFEKAPDPLPCGQHDRFADVRAVTQKMIKQNPALLVLLTMGPPGDNLPLPLWVSPGNVRDRYG